MIKEQRFDIIISELKKKEHVTFAKLASKLKISEDTIRRDIDYLERNGLLAKVRGGATIRSKNPLTFQDRNNFLKKEKDVIGMKALRFIKEGFTMFMDGGTTNCSVASCIPVNISLRIITNNQVLIPILTEFKNIELITLGGTYDKATETSTGIVTCNQIRNYVADLYLMGTCAVDAKIGVTATYNNDAEIKKAMLYSSHRTVSLVNTHPSLRAKTTGRTASMRR